MGSKEEHRKSRSVLNEMKSAVRPAFDCDLYKRIELREITKDLFAAKKTQYDEEMATEVSLGKMIVEYSGKLGLDIPETIAWLAAEEAKTFTKQLDRMVPIEEPVQE